MPRSGTHGEIISWWTDDDIRAAIDFAPPWYGCSSLYIKDGRLLNRNVPILPVVLMRDIVDTLADQYAMMDGYGYGMMENHETLSTMVEQLRKSGHTPFIGYTFTWKSITPDQRYRVNVPKAWLVPRQCRKAKAA